MQSYNSRCRLGVSSHEILDQIKWETAEGWMKSYHSVEVFHYNVDLNSFWIEISPSKKSLPFWPWTRLLGRVSFFQAEGSLWKADGSANPCDNEHNNNLEWIAPVVIGNETRRLTWAQKQICWWWKSDDYAHMFLNLFMINVTKNSHVAQDLGYFSVSTIRTISMFGLMINCRKA